MLPRIVQIVKRFGPVGGMETYVWQLTHGLSERGVLVSVICEELMGEVSPSIDVIQLDKSAARPRWKSMLRFRAQVAELVKEQFQGQRIIVHSHERSLSHHVTTFHGPPINANGNLNWIQRLSPRIRGWMHMERHELLSSSVQCIVPVSSRVGDALTDQYSDLKNKQVLLGWPGVEPVVDSRGQDDGRRESSRFLFVGKEWKRKGLRRAIDVFEAFRAANPNAALDVFGVVSSDVPKKLSKKAGIRFKGWSSEISWGNYDVLIHPAENEPFGMVIAEARSHGIAVLMSDRVGAADLLFNNVRVVTFDAPLSEWESALQELMASPDRSSEVKWTWNDLVDLHCQTIYPRLEVEIL